MIGVNSIFKSRVSKLTNQNGVSGFPWYIYTPQKDHMWAQTWEDAMQIAVQAAREAQIEALR